MTDKPKEHVETAPDPDEDDLDDLDGTMAERHIPHRHNLTLPRRPRRIQRPAQTSAQTSNNTVQISPTTQCAA